MALLFYMSSSGCVVYIKEIHDENHSYIINEKYQIRDPLIQYNPNKL